MTIHSSVLRKLALSSILVAAPFNMALAQDAAALADRLKANLAAHGMDISWTNVTGDASSLVLEGASVKPVDETEALPIGNLTFAGVSEEGGNLFVESVTTAPFSKSEDGVTVDISEIVISDLSLPAVMATDPIEKASMLGSFELASMTVKMGDKTPFALEGLAYELTAPEEGKPMEYSLAAEKFNADLTLIDDPQAQAVIKELGYENIAGFWEMAGSWQPTDGRLAISQTDIAVENAGTIGFTFDMGGLTLDLAKSLEQLQKKMAEAPADGDNSADGIAMLGLMQQLSVVSASVRFDDDSLTGKVLEFMGKQQGVSGPDFANQVKALAPMMLMQLNNPDLLAQISTAINAYLDDPQNIEVAAAPAAPVPFPMLMAGAADPMALTKTLGVKVTANQK
jgi:hypothetical protein